MPGNPVKIRFVSAEFVDNDHAVWFEASKTFFWFQDPAWQVLIRLTKGQSRSSITNYMRTAYGYNPDLVETFVRDLIRQIRKYNDPASNPYKPPGISAVTKKVFANPFSRKNYCINNRRISVSYGTRLLEENIHPVLAHLETSGTGKADAHLSLAQDNKLFLFRYNRKLREAFRKQDLAYLKGAVFQQLFSAVHDVPYNGWMMTFHASGITDGRTAILFSGESGKGKSTLAALMQAHGYGVVADDFIPVCKNKGEAYCFPVPLSAKEGAWETLQEYYPGFLETTDAVSSVKGLPVRYLSTIRNLPEDRQSYPIKAIVFVTYDKWGDFRFNETNQIRALLEILSETWVNPTARNVRQFFRWAQQARFYRLSYYRNQQAIEAIQKVFTGEQ